MTKVAGPAAAALANQAKGFDVLVRAMRWEAPGVMSVEIAALDGGDLPPFEPGAHIDLHLPGNIVRQYSLFGDPADPSCYRIGVRSVGGGVASGFVHRRLRPGEVVTVSAPRNNFPLVRSERYLFIAGGIGITPLMPMMPAADAAGAPWTLLYCNKNAADAPFLQEIRRFAGTLSLHSSQDGTRLEVAKAVATPQENTALYCCGPESLMVAVEEAAAGWPAGSVHFEWFTPRSRAVEAVPGLFDVVCERSGRTLEVPPDRSVLAVLNDAGIAVPCSCQQGVCGTCEVRVLSGDVDHRDSILSSAEQAANETMMTCVSRSKGARLVLDI
ncbi:MAG: PDR/VanB family oxidoreductase [Alphaproteobacteria bacterium]|nr:PDR/VanB family oxidoreductase [Alphaproteobacteria bacterium]